MLKSLYVLAGLPKFSTENFSLFLECGHSSVAAGAGAGAGPSAVGAGAGPSAASSTISASSTFSSFLSAKYRIRHGSIWCCHEDKVW